MIVSVGLIYSVFGFKANINVATVKSPEKSGSPGPGLGTKSSSGQVSIDLTPSRFEAGKLYVDARLNTHSGDLGDYNLKEAVTLEFDGKFISPSSVPELSGHHSGGIFMFDAGSEPDSFIT